MFTGHAGLALLAKRARPSIPLWLLLGAAYASDGAELLLNLLRVPDERLVAMLSHSVVGDLVGATALGAIYWLARRDGAGALLLGATLISHWPADFLTGHEKPTWPGGPRLGLFLYRYNVLDFLMEAAVLLGAWLLLRRATAAAPASPPATHRFPRLARAVRVLPLALLPVQLSYNVIGYLGLWDWKTVMLRGTRATARAVRDELSLAPAAAPCDPGPTERAVSEGADRSSSHCAPDASSG